ncbi:hypothetical protein HY086_03975 [Candidatus Gottesmanbacteria bacterium]|nr:hypothetical protein [Candidatus Gottesmanbacteria bacterium]
MIWDYRKITFITSLAVLAFVLPMQKGIDPVKRRESRANRILRTCTKTTYPPTCYNGEIPKTLSVGSLADSFEIVKLIREKDHTFLYCHDVAHLLGRAAVKKNRKEWRKTLADCQFGTCANGCLHGVVQEVVKEEIHAPLTGAARQSLTTICQGDSTWRPNIFEKSHCYMAMGSVFNYFTNANISASLLLCDEATTGGDGLAYARLCYDGVFDQIFRPKEREDANLVRGKAPIKEAVRGFCDQFTSESFGALKQSSCLNETWPLFRQEVSTPEGLEWFCSQGKDTEGADACYKVLFQRVAQNNNFDVSKIADFCRHISTSRQALCLGAAAINAMVTEKEYKIKVQDICNVLDNPRVSQECDSIIKQFMSATQEELFCASPAGRSRK